MQSRIPETSSRYLVGLTSGALVLLVFGTLWAGLSLQGLHTWGLWTVIVIAGVVAVALGVPCLTTLHAARRLHRENVTPEEQARGQKVSRRFGLVVGVEGTAIAAANVLLSLLNHSEFIAPAMALIVGTHFLPLAFLFQVRVYALVGAVLSLLGGGALLALLFGLPLGSLYTWSLIVGLSTAVILWLTSLSILAGARRLLSLLQQSPEGASGVEKEKDPMGNRSNNRTHAMLVAFTRGSAKATRYQQRAELSHIQEGDSSLPDLYSRKERKGDLLCVDFYPHSCSY